METMESYLERKYRELSLLGGCLASPLDLKPPDSVAAAIEQKFRLAGALKAERSLNAWAVTETARDSAHRSRSGAFEFNYGYQRADLSVRGPAIYTSLASPNGPDLHETLYTGSGMSAMAAVLTALQRVRGVPELLVPEGCYSETVELLDSFGKELRVLAFDGWRARPRAGRRARRIMLLDSSVRSGFFPPAALSAGDVDMVIFDTTCFWKNSTRIRRVIDWALQSGAPMALVRSHAKLDCLGVEYGRLGSVVFAARLRDVAPARAAWIREVIDQTRESVRLFGTAPVPAHFPPFTACEAYERCSVARVAAIIRGTRRMTRAISAALGDTRRVSSFQHGLYLTLSPAADLGVDEVRDLAGNLSGELERMGLPVRHAGSFGFDFVAIEWYHGSASSKNLVRVAAADLPPPLSDRIAEGIAAWWSVRGMSSPDRSARENVMAAPRHANVS
jgi:hypothetical protein